MLRSRFRSVFICGIFISLAFVFGCKDESGPKLQTLPGKGDDKLEVEQSKPPTDEERKVALARLNRAIEAHGGEKVLAKLNVQVQRFRGKMHYAAENFDYETERELKLVFPDRLRLTAKFYAPDPRVSSIRINGKSGWRSAADGIVAKMPAEEYRDVKEEIQFMRILSLAPLKEEPYVLRPIEGEKVNRRDTDAIEVECPLHLPVKLYFDRQSGLLVRAYGRHREKGEIQIRDVLFYDHKSFEGVVLPTRIDDLRNGIALIVNNTVEYSFPSQIDPKDFENPNPGLFDVPK
jgi:hypothetical protein